MLLGPVKQRELKLSHALQQFLIILSFAHFLTHVFADSSDALVAFVRTISHEQVELRVFFYLYAQLIEPLDGCVAGKEVLWTWSERNNLQSL